MTTPASESLPHGADVSKDTSNDNAEMCSGEPRPLEVNGEISVAFVQNASVPKAKPQTAEHVQLGDDKSRKCCTLQ